MQIRTIKIAAALVLGVLLLGNAAAHRLENGLARTPPMGWSSWNRFHCDITEADVKGIVDAICSSGLRAAGYEFVNIDDCWEALSRDPYGNLISNPVTFPSGMKALGDYIHSRSLKFGLYSSVGRDTYASRPASGNHEQQDMNAFASWGVDYAKIDFAVVRSGTSAPSYRTHSLEIAF